MDENPQTMSSPRYPDGSRVLYADGQTLGEVVATYREYLIVERGSFFPTSFYVPYAAIAEAGGGDIVLSLDGHDALAQGWHTPPQDPVVPEAQRAPVPPPAEPVATTSAPIVPAKAAATEPVVTTTAVPTAAEAEEIEPEAEQADEPTAREQVPQGLVGTPIEPTTTAAPADPVEETVVEEVVEVQSFQPDASVPPPAEPEEAGTVNLAPSFVGIPGRRLTDAELWSLLEPKDSPEESDEAAGHPENTPNDKDTLDKPGS